MPKYKISIPKRDMRVLRFLWKWKFVSSSALFTKHYPNLKPASAYNKLNGLRQKNLIQTVYINGQTGFAWGLTDKGYAFVKESLPELVNSNYKSDKKSHDFMVTAFHYGDWLLDLPKGVELISEQQLKCYHPQFLPPWLPDTNTHRPDGYWKLTSPEHGSVIVALEVELTQKSNARYFKVKDFYNHYQHIQFVVWVAPNLATARRFQSIMTEQSPATRAPHQFVLANDFAKKGWGAKVVLGTQKGHTVSEFMEAMSGTTSIQQRSPGISGLLLNLALKPLEPNTYASSPKR